MTRAPRSRFYDGWIYARLLEPWMAGLHAFVAERLLPGGLVPEAGPGETSEGEDDLEARPEGGTYPRRIVDIGCGTGSLALRLAAHADSVVGVDLSPAMVEFARRSAQRQRADNASFVLGDVVQAFPGTADRHFDLATMVLMLHELPAASREAVLLEGTRIAKQLVCVDFRVPMPRNLAGLRNRFLEVMAGPEHYRAFRDFNRRGGTAGIALAAGLTCRHLRHLDAATLDVSVITRG